MLTACSPQGGSPQDTGQRYLCTDAQTLAVIRSTDQAIVRLGERLFTLSARKGSLGARFTDGDAILIFDADLAVFVTGEGRDALNCELIPDI